MTLSIRAFQRSFLNSAAVAILVACALVSAALVKESSATAVDPAKLEAAVAKAASYFATAQADDGSFSASTGFGPGITAIVATSLLRSGHGPNDPVVAKALKYLEKNRREDGGIYQAGSRTKNYETCLSILAFNEANRDGRYKDLLAAAEKFIKQQQWDEDESHDESSLSYGGAGYGSHERPDLSNTTFFVEALHSIGRDAEDPAIQKALVFISRCQNLESKYNTSPFAAKINDGGFYYTIAAGGQSQAGPTPDGGLRSYGSMTYAGLKSMIYAGLNEKDPRVKAAHDWIRAHYTVEENPGMADAGLYYYYQTFAKALSTLGDDVLVDSSGNEHDWRADIAERLISTQKADGTWINSNTRWLEGDPNLVTAYALLALSYSKK